MSDRAIELLDEIYDVECQLEDAEECGDLEERLELTMLLYDLKRERLNLAAKELGEDMDGW